MDGEVNEDSMRRIESKTRTYGVTLINSSRQKSSRQIRVHLSAGFSNLLDPSCSTTMSWSSEGRLARFLINFMVSWSSLVPLGIGRRYIRVYSVT